MWSRYTVETGYPGDSLKINGVVCAIFCHWASGGGQYLNVGLVHHISLWVAHGLFTQRRYSQVYGCKCSHQTYWCERFNNLYIAPRDIWGTVYTSEMARANMTGRVAVRDFNSCAPPEFRQSSSGYFLSRDGLFLCYVALVCMSRTLLVLVLCAYANVFACMCCCVCVILVDWSVTCCEESMVPSWWLEYGFYWNWCPLLINYRGGGY